MNNTILALIEHRDTLEVQKKQLDKIKLKRVIEEYTTMISAVNTCIEIAEDIDNKENSIKKT